jgi:hypothetical protein
LLQAILLTSSLLLMLGMCASLMWLAAVRVPQPVDAGPAQQSDPDA